MEQICERNFGLRRPQENVSGVLLNHQAVRGFSVVDTVL